MCRRTGLKTILHQLTAYLCARPAAQNPKEPGIKKISVLILVSWRLDKNARSEGLAQGRYLLRRWRFMSKHQTSCCSHAQNAAAKSALKSLLISVSFHIAHKCMLTAAGHVCADYVAGVIDSKGASKRRSREINGGEFAVVRTHVAMNSATRVAVNAHNVALCIDIPCLRKRSIGIIECGGYSAAYSVRAYAVDAHIHEEPSKSLAALCDAIVHKAHTIQATELAAEEGEGARILGHTEHRRASVRVVNAANDPAIRRDALRNCAEMSGRLHW